ncbi:unnamed protein product [Prorocentrum cordatum]|uniref:Uncharacterized protein n=1 Tax=Prorocentrum cordatum TaxID=2364126 RepID=A0ABN9XTX9_9DINO|nr:unnamed protein product [Polarella glacialis]
MKHRSWGRPPGSSTHFPPGPCLACQESRALKTPLPWFTRRRALDLLWADRVSPAHRACCAASWRVSGLWELPGGLRTTHLYPRVGAFLHPSKEEDQVPQPRYPGFDKYPDCVRVTFSFDERELLTGSQELGLRYASACQELGEALGIDPAVLAEAYADPRLRSATGRDVAAVGALPEDEWPVTFEFPKQRRRYNLLFGLGGSGKTTLLRALGRRSGQPLEATAGQGCRVESLALDDFTCFTSWDITGLKEASRKLLEGYCRDVLSVCFVVDASDPSRIDEARQALADLLGESSALSGATLLVYANKRDVEGALPATEVAERLMLSSLRIARCFVQSSCAVTGDGVFQGIAWLSQAIGGARPSADGAEEPTPTGGAGPSAGDAEESTSI